MGGHTAWSGAGWCGWDAWPCGIGGCIERLGGAGYASLHKTIICTLSFPSDSWKGASNPWDSCGVAVWKDRQRWRQAEQARSRHRAQLPWAVVCAYVLGVWGNGRLPSQSLGQLGFPQGHWGLPPSMASAVFGALCLSCSVVPSTCTPTGERGEALALLPSTGLG